MAEEEVLTEQEAAPQKEKSGMSPMIILITIIATAGIIIVLLVSLGGKMGLIKSMRDDLKKIDASQKGIAAEREKQVTLQECDKVYDLTPERAQTFNMADGEHFISTKISVCVDKKVVDETLDRDRPRMLYIATDTLMRFSRADIFPPKSAQEQGGGVTAPASGDELDFGDEFEDIDVGEMGSNNMPAVRLNKIRGQLIQNLARNFSYIRDVYLYEFVVD